MNQQPWKKAVFGTVAFLVVAVTAVWGVLGESPLSCTIFDLTGKQTTVALVALASLGWIVAYVIFLVPNLSVLWKGHLERKILTEDSVLREVVSAKKLRIFSSGSQTLQRALHPHVSAVTHDLSIELLIRTDGSQARKDIIAREVQRWRHEIQRANVTLSIKLYSFEPVMLRGMVVDNKVAFTGWYYRESDRTYGQSDPIFRIADVSYVSEIVNLFDKMFAAGSQP